MKRPLLLLPLLALALPALAQDPATNAPASPKNAIVCKIVKRLETSNVVTLRISNRTSDPVDIDMNEVAGYGPRFLRLRAFDKFGVCSTNTPGARPDGFYAPRALASQLSERTNLVASLSRLEPGESRKFSVDVRKFFDDAAPFKAIRRIQPQATLFLPSGEERTVIGPRFSFRGLDASSWLKSFRKETGRTASGTLVFLESDWSAIHPEDYVFDTLQVYFATAVEGHERRDDGCARGGSHLHLCHDAGPCHMDFVGGNLPPPGTRDRNGNVYVCLVGRLLHTNLLVPLNECGIRQ